MASIETLLEETSRRWRETGVTMGPPATRKALSDFESKFHVKCPDDFAAYLLSLGGTPDGTWDEHLIRFWPLAEICPVTEMPNHEFDDYFVFADYSLSAHEYAIRLSEKQAGDVALFDGVVPKSLASTFGEFLALYLRDPLSLFR